MQMADKKINIGIENVIRYEGFVIVGVIMAIFALAKLLGFIDFSSDWFWFLAGVGLIIEGTISLIKQRKFERKYKIIERKEENK